MARIDAAYNYLLSTYGKTTGSRYDSHRKSELRSVYNNIIKTNKDSPLYKITQTGDVTEFAIDIKENARRIQNVIASLSDGGDHISSMLNKMIDISPPTSDLIDLASETDVTAIDEFLKGEFVRITFRMEIGDLVDSTIMQLYPYSFARDMYNSIAKNMEVDIAGDTTIDAPVAEETTVQPAMAPQMDNQANMAQPMMGQPMMGQPMMGQPMMGQPMNGQMMYQMPYPDPSMMGQPVNVQPAQFTPLMGDFNPIQQKENIDLIMDVPLEVTVELGRTSKSIKEILEFTPGTIIELNKIAGEPIDVLVNGKYVAKGEVVVLEENFGIRITDIIKA